MNKTKGLFFTASLVLALTLTQSCSGDDNSGGGGDPSSSSGGETQGGGDPSSSSNGGQGGGNSSSGGGGGGGSNCTADFGEVTIGSQIWAKKNLDCDVQGSKCYDNDPANCTKYGRLYDWLDAMALSKKDCRLSEDSYRSCLNQIQAKHKGICPSGWHLPTKAEWDILVNLAGGASSAGKKLRATSGWEKANNTEENSTDEFGFSALPGGYGNSGSGFGNVGLIGHWWSASVDNDGYTYDLQMVSTGMGNGVTWESGSTSEFYSVRCIKD